MKILVTGATGNTGRYVIDELLKMGEKVVAGDIQLAKIQTLFGQTVDAVYFDFTDIKTYEQALEGVDRVFLMRPPHLGKPKDLYPFIDAMKVKNIQLVSFLSLMGVEKNSIPPHHKIEKYIEKQGIPYAYIRPSFFMQNISGVHAVEIKEMNEIMVPAGHSQTSFIDARDIGLAAATLLHHPLRYQNTAHTITGPEALNYHQIAHILSEITGRTIDYKNRSFLSYRNHYIKNRKLDKKYVNVTVALYFMTRMGTASKVTQTFRELTGKDPHSFEMFANDFKISFQ